MEINIPCIQMETGNRPVQGVYDKNSIRRQSSETCKNARRTPKKMEKHLLIIRELPNRARKRNLSNKYKANQKNSF